MTKNTDSYNDYSYTDHQDDGGSRSSGAPVGMIIGIVVCLLVVVALVAGVAGLMARLKHDDRASNRDTLPNWQGDMQIHINSNGEINVQQEQSRPSETQPMATEAGKRFYVHADGGLNVRSGPGTQFEAVGRLENGSAVTVGESSNGWAYITGPLEGWCSAEYLREEPLYGTPDITGPDKIDPDSYLRKKSPANTMLVGQWLVIEELVSDYLWCRTGILTLRDDGTFDHACFDSVYADGSWYFPGGITSGGDCPTWKGEYTFDGYTLVLHYRLEDYWVLQDHSQYVEVVDSGWKTVSYDVYLPVYDIRSGEYFSVNQAYTLPSYSQLRTEPATCNTLFFLGDIYAEAETTCFMKLAQIYP